jgi:hypothetical protein
VTSDVVAYLLATIAVVTVGVLWLVNVGRTGATRGAGKIDGVLTLAFVFFTLCAVVLAAVACWRAANIHKIRTTWPSVDAAVVKSQVFQPMRTFNPTVYTWDSRTGQFTAERLGLETVWLYTSPAGPEREATTRTCCVVSHQHLQEWEQWYRPGSRHRLYVDPNDGTVVRIDYAMGPIGETGPRASASQAFRFAVVAITLYAIARWIVARRRASMIEDPPV